MMCEIAKVPFLLIFVGLLYLVLVIGINKWLIRKMRMADPEALDSARGKPNVNREMWESEKNEAIVQNVFLLIMNKRISSWEGVHFGVILFQLTGWVVALYMISLLSR